MGPENMKRRQKRYQEQALTRINELKGRISSLDSITRVYKEQTKQQITLMLGSSSVKEAKRTDGRQLEKPSRIKVEEGTYVSSGTF